MTEHLNHLRSACGRLRDSNIKGLRELGLSMLVEIDQALAAPQAIRSCDLSRVRSADLVEELHRRLRDSKGPRMCKQCAKNRCRAKGLCMRCYQIARKQERRKTHERTNL